MRQSELTAAERKYGRAPKRDPSVTYRPGVILLDAGADAVRGADPSGMQWTLDARLPGVSAINAGSVVFITNQCVGRVLAAKREGDEMSLVIGPVDLTDIYQDLEVHFNGPVPLEQAEDLPELKFPGWTLPIESAAAESNPMFMHAQLPQAPGIIPNRLDNSLTKVEAVDKSRGLGMVFTNEGKGFRVQIGASLEMNQPELQADVSIHFPRITAKVVLKNAVMLDVSFNVATGDGFNGNVDWWAPGGAVPTLQIAGPHGLAIHFGQSMHVTTQFASKNSSFSASSKYGLNADIGFQFDGTGFKAIGPNGFTIEQSVIDDMHGVSLRPRGLTVIHTVWVNAGLGNQLFVIGPRADIRATLGAALGSEIGIVECRGGSLSLDLRAGIGYSIWGEITHIINIVLSLLDLQPISSSWSFDSDWQNLFHKTAEPASKACQRDAPKPA